MSIRRRTDTGEWTTRRYLSLLGSLVIWAIVAVDAWYLWPTQLHGSTSMVIVSGHSMEPTYFSGDLVIARKMTPSIGDVIVYAPTGLGGSQIVHRIIGGNATDGWQMQGDNNDFVDPFTPKGKEVKGVVLVHYANFGRVTVLLLNPIIWALVLLTAIVLLVWWGGDTCEDEPTDDDEGGGSADQTDVANDSTNADRAGAPRAPPKEEPSRAFIGDAISEGAQASAAQASAAQASAAQPGGLRALVTPKRGIVAALVGILSLGFAVSPASASGLIVNPAGSAAVLKYSHCANQTLAATVSGTASGGSYSSVSLSGIAAACQGKVTTVNLYNVGGGLLSTGSATPTAATAAVTMPSYVAANVTTVVVVVDGWPFIASWTPPVAGPTLLCEALNPGGQVRAGYPCTVQVNPNGSAPWGYDRGTMLWNYTFQVTWTTQPPNSNWKWRVTIDQSAAPFPGFTPQWVGVDYNPGIALSSGYSCGQRPVIQFTSTASTVWGATINIANGPAPSWFSGQSFCS